VSQVGGSSDLNSYAALMGLDHRVHVDHDVGGGGGIGIGSGSGCAKQCAALITNNTEKIYFTIPMTRLC
jgi:hypothetical protein